MCVVVAATVGVSGCKSDKKDESAEAQEAQSEATADKQPEAAPAAAAKTEKPNLTAKTDATEATVAKGGACDAPVELAKLDKKTVLSADGGGCFLVKHDLTVSGPQSSLTIEPGVTVKFAENAGLRIDKGALVAKGTAAKPIVLTGEREVPGYWKGVAVRGSEHTNNVIDHAKITYAGNDNNYGHVKPAALMFDNHWGKVSFTVHNTELTHSAGHGLYAEEGVQLDFAVNKLTENKAGAAFIAPEMIGQLDDESTYTGNETDEVTVWGRGFEKLEATWPGIGVPYHVTGDVTIGEGSFVKIAPGATFTFDENTGLGLDKGKLAAEGSAQAPIVLTGAREVAGFWKGVRVRGSDSMDNRLDHVAIRFAGAPKTFGHVKPAALMFDNHWGKVSFAISNTELSHSAGHGLYAEDGVELDFAANKLTENKAGAALIAPEIIGQLDAKSTFAGNEADEVTVWGRGFENVEATWPGIDAPFHITGDVSIGEGSFVKVEPGAVFEFDENTGLTIDKGKFAAKGSSEKPITFKGARSVAGIWKGLRMRGTSSIDNILAHVVVEDAGAPQNFGHVQPAALMFDDHWGHVSFALADLTVRNSQAGLYVENDVTLDVDDCSTLHIEADPKFAPKSKALDSFCKK